MCATLTKQLLVFSFQKKLEIKPLKILWKNPILVSIGSPNKTSFFQLIFFFSSWRLLIRTIKNNFHQYKFKDLLSLYWMFSLICLLLFEIWRLKLKRRSPLRPCNFVIKISFQIRMIIILSWHLNWNTNMKLRSVNYLKVLKCTFFHWKPNLLGFKSLGTGEWSFKEIECFRQFHLEA